MAGSVLHEMKMWHPMLEIEINYTCILVGVSIVSKIFPKMTFICSRWQSIESVLHSINSFHLLTLPGRP